MHQNPGFHQLSPSLLSLVINYYCCWLVRWCCGLLLLLIFAPADW